MLFLHTINNNICKYLLEKKYLFNIYFQCHRSGLSSAIKKCEKIELTLINQLINNEEKRVNTKKHRGYLFKDTVEAA
jgi:hypothetical protein